jgi:hypothetical protein
MYIYSYLLPIKIYTFINISTYTYSYDTNTNDPSAKTTFTSANHSIEMKKMLIFFENSRASRIKKLEFFSEISQFIGQIENPYLCRIRDNFVYIVPQYIKGRVFDVFIRAVSSFKM